MSMNKDSLVQLTEEDEELPPMLNHWMDPTIALNDKQIEIRSNIMKEYYELQQTSTIGFTSFNIKTEELKMKFHESLIESMILATPNDKTVNTELVVNTLYEAYRFEDFFDNYCHSDEHNKCLRNCDTLNKLLSVMFERMEPNKFGDKLNYIKKIYDN